MEHKRSTKKIITKTTKTRGPDTLGTMIIHKDYKMFTLTLS